MIRAADRPRFGGQHGVHKGRSPSGALIWGPLAASWGLSAVFSLLSSPLLIFKTSLRWPRDTAEMQGTTQSRSYYYYYDYYYYYYYYY